ncbi:glutamine amidotransferase [Noviherbaspirillum denitrificans]|uniref:Glutamine amidotransferase n=2 Tax=Noviherbaspirillum denitrificans TaxID=1968433 RepID=A0A254T6F4_9BURK|nr:glutamine amidotransferase [Noviherbaspirillum denitrificans]
MKSFVIFKVGDTFPSLSAQLGDFDRWIINGIGPSTLPVTVVDPRTENALPDMDKVAAAVVTGSHSMVSDRAPWSENLAAWLRSAVEENIPVLGICYGHQLLAHALGGEVGYHPDGIELGTVCVSRTKAANDDPLFGGLPDEFPAHVVHRQSVLRLPPGAVRLACNDFEPHHAFRAGEIAWGVQFHPEFSADAMSGYVTELTDASKPGALPRDSISGQVRATSEAASLLPRFASLVAKRMDAQA